MNDNEITTGTKVVAGFAVVGFLTVLSLAILLIQQLVLRVT